MPEGMVQGLTIDGCGNKAVVLVYDKPMFSYPLLLAGISDKLIISTPEDTPRRLADTFVLGAISSKKTE